MDDLSFRFRDYYMPKVISTPIKPMISVQPIPFTDQELKSFDKALGLKRTAQKTKMRRVFQSCGFTESKFTRSGKRLKSSKREAAVRTIYIVTYGSYSDYSIDSVFDSEEATQACIDYYTHDRYRNDLRIEEYTLNRYGIIKQGHKCYRVYFEIIDDSASASVKIIPGDDGEFEGRDEFNDCVDYWTNVWAMNEKIALKIANERRARYLASGKVGL